jgi:hypothetical protein
MPHKASIQRIRHLLIFIWLIFSENRRKYQKKIDDAAIFYLINSSKRLICSSKQTFVRQMKWIGSLPVAVLICEPGKIKSGE